ncbi:MAG: glycosyltransferase family 39 protein [Candidatus Competibacter sp.]|nr:glycosyltransferase family 39 protein [Candidatus Competibacter sp.]
MIKQTTGPAGSDSVPSGKVRFVLVGLLTFAIDLAILNFFYSQGFSLSLAHIISFLAASGTGYLLNLIGSHKDTSHLAINRVLKVIITTLLILFLRGGILASLMRIRDFPPEVAIVIGVTVSSGLNYLGSVYYIFRREAGPVGSESERYYFVIAIIIYSILLRLFYLGLPELLYEEAYYWNYAKHLDIGYLDHPPMVAWIIALFTKLMGDNEFAVRFGAFLCWFIAAYFSCKLTRDVRDRSSASQAVLLVATLPAYFGVGFLMTPDAPLVACWAAALYFLHQALIHGRRMAWAGVGISIGLGMLSKYTIALLGPAALLFILVDRPSRKWLFRPEPYLAVILALALFSPVIVWNAEHEWASFLYQSYDRVTGRLKFSLPIFLCSMILIITPTGILSFIAILLHRKVVIFRNDALSGDTISRVADRGYYLLMTLTLLPVIVFGALSLFRETKFHWTVPCWLSIVPYMALIVTRKPFPNNEKLLEWSRRAWPATMTICLICYGAVLHYLALGFPGVPYPQKLYLLGWQGFGREIEALVEQVEHELGEKILVVGMDRNRIASGLAFYRTTAIDSSSDSVIRQPAFQTSSWHLFGARTLMYEYWFPIGEQNDKTLLLVSRGIDNMTSDNVRSRVRQMGDVKEIKLSKNGKPAGHYYYSLVKGYQSKQPDGTILTVTPGD